MVTFDNKTGMITPEESPRAAAQPLYPFSASKADYDWSALDLISGEAVAASLIGCSSRGRAEIRASESADSAGETEEDEDFAIETVRHFIEECGYDVSYILQKAPGSVTVVEFVAYLSNLEADELEEIVATGRAPQSQFDDYYDADGEPIDPVEAFEVAVILYGSNAADACVEEVLSRTPDGYTPLSFARAWVELTDEQKGNDLE